MKTGDLQVTAQVLEELDNGFVSVEVLKCKVLKVGPLGVEVTPFRKHDKFRRKRSTITRTGERMVPEAEAPPRLHGSKFTRRSS